MMPTQVEADVGSCHPILKKRAENKECQGVGRDIPMDLSFFLSFSGLVSLSAFRVRDAEYLLYEIGMAGRELSG